MQLNIILKEFVHAIANSIDYLYEYSKIRRHVFFFYIGNCFEVCVLRTKVKVCSSKIDKHYDAQATEI